MAFFSDIAPRPARSWLLWVDYVLSSRLPARVWMTSDAFRRFAWQFARQEGSEPLPWRAGLQWQARHRLFRALQQNEAIIAADYNVRAAVPFVAPDFVAALGHCAGALGFSDRAQAMGVVAGDLLPRAILTRRSKGGFNRAYFTAISRDFVAAWDGAGLDTELVDPGALRQAWQKTVPPAPSYALLQAAWMAQHRVPVGGDVSDGPADIGRQERSVAH